MTTPSVPSLSTAIIPYHPTQRKALKIVLSPLDVIITYLMERSFQAQIADFQNLYHFEKGDIIVIAGTSTAGKSSIVQALKQLEPDRREEDLDLRRNPMEPTRPGMQLEMIDDALNHSLAGRKVVVHVDQGYKFIQRMSERGLSVPVRVVLAFCPFHELSRRLLERNQWALGPLGDIRNSRDPIMPISNFGELYTRKTGTESGLERITRLQATRTFNAHFDEMVVFAKQRGNPLPSNNQLAIDKVTFCNEFLSNLGFRDNVQEIEIEPRFKNHYHFIFNTYEHRDADGLREIAKTLHLGTDKA